MAALGGGVVPRQVVPRQVNARLPAKGPASFVFRLASFVFQVSGFGFRLSGFGFQVSSFRFRVGVGVLGAGFRPHSYTGSGRAT